MPQPLMELIDNFLTQVDFSKKADNDPGGYKGKSSHPSAKVEDHNRPATEGSRSAENTKDVKEDHPGAGVDNVKPSSGGSEDDHMLHIGLTPSATGEDPSVEDNYKKDKEDPKSTHPSHNVEDEGEKWSSMDFRSLAKTASALANKILADMGNGYFEPPTKTAKDAKPGTTPTSKVAQAPTRPTKQELAGAAGNELAVALAQVKEAEDAYAKQLIAQTIKDAELGASLVGSFFQGYASEKQALAKKADDGDVPPQAGGVTPPMAAGAPEPPMGGGGDAGAPPMDPASMMGAAGGGGAPPMDPAAMMGAGGGGAPPMGGPPMGGPGGDAGGQVSEEEAIKALLDAMNDLHLSPEQLQQGGGEEGAKVASVAMNYKKAGKYTYTPAKTAKEEKLRRDMAGYIFDLLKN
jgi:hypothetical protein